MERRWKTDEKEASFDDAIIEIDYYRCSGYAFWLTCIIIALLSGSIYSDSSFLKFAYLNRTRNPYSAFKFLEIRQTGKNTLTAEIHVDYIFNITRENLISHLVLEATNGGFNFTKRISAANDVKMNDKNITFSFNISVRGIIYAVIKYNNRPISRVFKFSIANDSKSSSYIYCNENKTGKYCIFYNVCVKNSRIQANFEEIPHQNPGFLPYDLSGVFEHVSRYGRVNMEEEIFKAAFVRQKENMYLTIKDFLEQCDQYKTFQTIVFDERNYLNQLNIANNLDVVVSGRDQKCFRNLMINNFKSDATKVRPLIRNIKQRKQEIYVLNSDSTIKEIDSLVDSILDFCVRCEIVYADKKHTAKGLLNMKYEPQFIVGVQTDSMIATVFMNTTLISVVPKGLSCSDWISDASKDGLRAVQVFPKQKASNCTSYFCDDYHCSDIIKGEFIVNPDLVGNALAGIFRNNCPPLTSKVDCLTGEVLEEERYCY